MQRLTMLIAALTSLQPALHASSTIEVMLHHPYMDRKIGQPAVILPGQPYPDLEIRSLLPSVLHVSLQCTDSGDTLKSLEPLTLVPGKPQSVSLGEELPEPGRYRIQLETMDGAALVYRDAYYFSVLNPALLPAHHSLIAHPGPDGKLRYTPDFRGNRIPDFSGVGYEAGMEPPEVPTRIRMVPAPGDDTARIQEGIDQLSALPLQSNGYRGALLLEQGIYEIEGTLRIETGGVALRGEGEGSLKDLWLDPAKGHTLEELKESLSDKPATILIATGSDRRVLLTVRGSSGMEPDETSGTEILDAYVPVGGRTFAVENSKGFSPGDRILLERRGNSDWISYIKMDQIPPRPDGDPIRQWTPFNLSYEHRITSVEGNLITIDPGLFSAVEKRWGGGRILHYSDEGRIERVGVENLRAISFWQKNRHGVDDTNHSDRFILFDNIRNAWVRNVATEHFFSISGTFFAGRASSGVTFQDSSSLIAHPDFYRGEGYDRSGRTYAPTGIYVGRYGFYLGGRNALVLRGYALHSRHAFVVASRVPGPNVFFDSLAEASLTYSEPHHRWSTAGLYDNVSDLIALMNRLRWGGGHGWAGANYVAWNTSGELICEQPPTAQNWAIGHVGNKRMGPFHDWNMEKFGYSLGYWESLGSPVEPRSLYLQQRQEQKEVLP